MSPINPWKIFQNFFLEGAVVIETPGIAKTIIQRDDEEQYKLVFSQLGTIIQSYILLRSENPSFLDNLHH